MLIQSFTCIEYWYIFLRSSTPSLIVSLPSSSEYVGFWIKCLFVSYTSLYVQKLWLSGIGAICHNIFFVTGSSTFLHLTITCKKALCALLWALITPYIFCIGIVKSTPDSMTGLNIKSLHGSNDLMISSKVCVSWRFCCLVLLTSWSSVQGVTSLYHYWGSYSVSTIAI